jgi:acetyl esterase/lipase
VILTRLALALVAALAVPAMTAPAPTPPPADGLLKWPDLLQRPRPEPDASVHYGPGPLQIADVWLPKGAEPHPVVLMVHGGCWQSDVADRRIMNWIADDLRKRGIAVWNIDYRGVDRDGGGYPGTFLDAAAATDALKAHAAEYRLDLSHVIAVGHSAGGHLALWLAARTDRSLAPFAIHLSLSAPTAPQPSLAALAEALRPLIHSPSWETSAGHGKFTAIFRFPAGTDPEFGLKAVREALPEFSRHIPVGASAPEVTMSSIPSESPLRADRPLHIWAVIAAGALPDLKLTQAPPGTGCGLDVVPKLVGPATAGRPDVFADTSAAELPRFWARQILVNGENDKIVPLGFAAAYRARRAERGEEVRLETVPRTGHVELIAPESEAWRRQVALMEEILHEKPVQVRVNVVKPR